MVVHQGLTASAFPSRPAPGHRPDTGDRGISRFSHMERLRACTGSSTARGPLLMSAPGIGWVLAFTIAAEIGEIERFESPTKLAGYTGLCPRVNQSGDKDRRGPLTKHGPRYLRWALLEATMHALKHPAYTERYQRNKKRMGKQRGAKVAQIDIARRLTHAIWHIAFSQPGVRSPRRRFSSGGLTALLDLRPRAKHPISPDPPAEEAIGDMSTAPHPDPREDPDRLPTAT